MEKQYKSPLDGIEVERSDLDLISQNGALADDRVFAELLRLHSGDTPVARGVFAGSYNNAAEQAAIVTSSGLSDSRIYISPFRAFIGSVAPTSDLEAYRNIRSAVSIGSGDGSTPTFLYQTQQLAAATNNRWDLVYARVDIDVDDASVIRYVKDITDVVNADSEVVTKSTTVTIGIVQGAEATTPVLPAIPTDTGSSYYIPLAYVLVPAGHLLTQSISKSNIFEVAPVLHLHRSSGAISNRVANGMYKTTGTVLTHETWTPSSGRPKAYLPPTMAGMEGLTLSLHFNGASSSAPLGAASIIDDSIDWRNRYIMVFASIGALVGNYSLAQNSGGTQWIPDGRNAGLFFMGQSFHDMAGGLGEAIIAQLNNASTGGQVAVGASVQLIVDTLSSGALFVNVGATDPSCEMAIQIFASAPFSNWR